MSVEPEELFGPAAQLDANRPLAAFCVARQVSANEQPLSMADLVIPGRAFLDWA